MIKNDNIVLSQSISKDLGIYIIDDQVYDVDFCPHKVYRKHITCDYPNISSEPMTYGKYGETHLLGGSAKGSSQWTLPEKNRGGQKAKHKRIDIQIHRMYGYMKALGISWGDFNTQVSLIAKYRDNIWIRGEMDVFPVMVNGRLSIIDTKFTKSVHNNFSSIKEQNIRHSTTSCWASFEDIQKNQPIMYHFLARNFKKTGLNNLIKFLPSDESKYRHLFAQNVDYNDTNFYFFVAGYDVPDISDELRHYEYEWTRGREILLDAMIEHCIIRISDCLKSEWKTNPQDYLCNSCSLKETCLK